MRINKYLAMHTTLSRRQADDAIASGRVTINRSRARIGDSVAIDDLVTLDNTPVNPELSSPATILLDKPVGYVCSRNGQGAPTVYDLIPAKFHNLNIAGRLDKDSSGLVVLTSDGDLLFELTHPRNNKVKTYLITTDRILSTNEQQQLLTGVDIGDSRLSTFSAIREDGVGNYMVELTEGRNRQIRRSIEAIGAKVVKLQRETIGQFNRKEISTGFYKII